MYASRWGFVNPSNTGAGFEFQVIAAVVIGGVSINGGVGTVLGVVLGVLLLGCVSAALPLLGIPGTAQSAIYGAVILVALLIDRLVRQQGQQPGGGRGHERMTETPPPPRGCRPAPAAWQVVLIRPETMTLRAADPRRSSRPASCPSSSSTSTTSSTASPFLPSSRMVALVLTMVIIAGEIDLSPAANMALSACLFAWAQAAGVPMPVAIAIGLARGAGDGRAQRPAW